MASGEQNATKNVTFWHYDYSFAVPLEVELQNDKVVSISDSTSKFWDYLKKLQIISQDRDIFVLLNHEYGEYAIFTLFYKDNFLKVRKKAEILGLTVIPGEKFEENKKESLERATKPNVAVAQ